MHPDLKNTHESMLELGIAALTHANWHANYNSMENPKWSQLSVLQAAHAAEILIKARIAQEHPLLIFDQLPKSTQTQSGLLDFEDLIDKAKTIQYSDLPERLWATTGIKIKDLDAYKKFGNLRNCIQHFAEPNNKNCSLETIAFIFKIIDPLINECWGLYAIDYNEDTEPYLYIVENLIRNDVEFLVSPDCLSHLAYVDMQWSKNQQYKSTMMQRFQAAGFDIT